LASLVSRHVGVQHFELFEAIQCLRTGFASLSPMATVRGNSRPYDRSETRGRSNSGRERHPVGPACHGTRLPRQGAYRRVRPALRRVTREVRTLMELAAAAIAAEGC